MTKFESRRADLFDDTLSAGRKMNCLATTIVRRMFARDPAIAFLHDGAADENIARQLLELKRIKDGVTAGINDHGVGGLKSVIGRELRDVGNIFKLAAIEGRFQGKCPIGVTLRCGPGQANDDRRNIPG